MPSYLNSAFLWLGSLTGSRHLDPHTYEKTAMREFEFEMHRLGVPKPAAASTQTRESRSASGHSRAKSEVHTRSSPRPQPAYNTLPRAKGHSRNSSYTPVLVVPGVVNTSFMLFSPELHQRQGSSGSTMQRRRMQQQRLSEKERRDLDGESDDDDDEVSRSSFDSLFESSSRSGHSRRSPSTSSSYTSYSSDVVDHDNGCEDPDTDCTVTDINTISHRSPYGVGDGD